MGTPKVLLRNMQIDFFNAQELNLQNGRTKASPTLNEEGKGQESVTEGSFLLIVFAHLVGGGKMQLQDRFPTTIRGAFRVQ